MIFCSAKPENSKTGASSSVFGVVGETSHFPLASEANFPPTIKLSMPMILKGNFMPKVRLPTFIGNSVVASTVTLSASTFELSIKAFVVLFCSLRITATETPNFASPWVSDVAVLVNKSTAFALTVTSPSASNFVFSIVAVV